MNDERFDFLRVHPVAKGLSDQGLREIAEASEIVRFQPGESVHRANEMVTSVFLVIHGRLNASIVDRLGNVVVQRPILPGGQFGGVSAALKEPAPIDCVAVDPSSLLKFEYSKALELFNKYPGFRDNFVQQIAQTIKSAILRSRHPHKPRTVGFFHQTAATRELTNRLYQRLAELGDWFLVLSDQPERPATEQIRFVRIVGGSAPLEMSAIRQQIAESQRDRRIIGDVETTIDPELVSKAFLTFERIFWCVTPENWQSSVTPLQAMLSKAPSWREKVCLVWLLGNHQSAPVADELRKLAHTDIKVSFNQPEKNQGPVVMGGFERLVHTMRGVQIGVALGGGAARGMAHLGVLKVLEQQGIVVDMIAGTSAGAMTGTLYASGMGVDYAIDRFVHDLRPSWFFRSIPRGDQWHLLYKYRMGQFDPMLRKYLGDRRLEQLSLPMKTITVDLIGGKAVVRETGDAVHGIVESINLPVLSKPINRQGQSLVDGGLIDNVPADVLESSGCNFVIAVTVTAKMEKEFARNRADTPTPHMRPASTLQTLLRSYLVQSVSINAIGVEPADIVIEPDVTSFQLTDFVRTDELAAIGEQATLAAIPQIRQKLHQLDPQLFPLGSG